MSSDNSLADEVAKMIATRLHIEEHEIDGAALERTTIACSKEGSRLQWELRIGVSIRGPLKELPTNPLVFQA